MATNRVYTNRRYIAGAMRLKQAPKFDPAAPNAAQLRIHLEVYSQLFSYQDLNIRTAEIMNPACPELCAITAGQDFLTLEIEGFALNGGSILARSYIWDFFNMRHRYRLGWTAGFRYLTRELNLGGIITKDSLIFAAIPQNTPNNGVVYAIYKMVEVPEGMFR